MDSSLKNPATVLPAEFDIESYKNTLQEAGRFCHALNQPLQTIMMTVEMMLEDVPSGSTVHENLEIIMAECEKMTDEIRYFRPMVKSRLVSC